MRRYSVPALHVIALLSGIVAGALVSSPILLALAVGVVVWMSVLLLLVLL